MAVFPLENGVFSGTLLRFNVREYVYIWSLIFSMFKFLCSGCVRAYLCVFVAIYVCSLYMLLIACLFREIGKWDLRGNGKWVIKWVNGGNGSIGNC